MISYVAGFLFDIDFRRVVLIHKKRPKWQENKLNAVGGKVEVNESPNSAMIREFREEAGLEIKNWVEFTRLHNNEYELYFFYAVSEDIDKVSTQTDEEIVIINIDNIFTLNIIPNLRWIIPMCLDIDHKYSKIEVINSED